MSAAFDGASAARVTPEACLRHDAAAHQISGWEAISLRAVGYDRIAMLRLSGSVVFGWAMSTIMGRICFFIEGPRGPLDITETVVAWQDSGVSREKSAAAPYETHMAGLGAPKKDDGAGAKSAPEAPKKEGAA